MTSKTMTSKSKGLHPNNLHQARYDFPELVKVCPELQGCLVAKDNGELSINFSEPESVLLLNKALLAYFYQITFWQLPTGYLCPPIPGRADYIHHIADLLNATLNVPAKGRQIKGVDIGCGANCIYPILGSRLYDWSFIASDIDTVAVKTAKLIVSANSNINKHIIIRQQRDPKSYFSGIIKRNERIVFTICNPPFHSSMHKATQGSQLKQHNLAKSAGHKNSSKTDHQAVKLNFAGQPHELSCEGGELAFIKKMIIESEQFKDQICWFTCLVSKSDNIATLKQQLKKQQVEQVKVVKMAQGNKISRFIAWSYLNTQQQNLFITR